MLRMIAKMLITERVGIEPLRKYLEPVYSA